MCLTLSLFRVKKILDPSYGSYIWPSSLVLAEYIWKCRSQFANTVVLEVCQLVQKNNVCGLDLKNMT
jgi:hypothetical protein